MRDDDSVTAADCGHLLDRLLAAAGAIVVKEMDNSTHTYIHIPVELPSPSVSLRLHCTVYYKSVFPDCLEINTFKIVLVVSIFIS